MRIAVFSDHFYPELGGIQDSIEALAAALAGRGHRVDFYAPRYSAADYRRGAAPRDDPDLGPNVRIFRLPSLPFPSSTAQSRLVLPRPWAWLRLLGASRPDVIHTQTFFGVGLEALTAGKLLNIPVVGTNHMAIKAFDAYLPVKMKWAVRYVVWYYNRCDFVTAPSVSVFNDLDLSPQSPRRMVISNPIDTKTFSVITSDRRRSLKAELGFGDVTLCYAGRLGIEKNVDAVIRALPLVRRRFGSVLFVVAGHGSHLDQLRKLAAELGVERHVRFLGTLDKSDLAKVFQASELFVTMSTSETQGMAMLQAMACGRPAIGAHSRALPEFIDAASGLTVRPDDHAALAKAVVTLLENDEQCQNLGRAAAVHASQFATGAVADRWESLYWKLSQHQAMA